MHIIDRLKARGLIQDLSDLEGLRSLSKGDRFYVGFDPSAPSLQLGNLVQMNLAIWLGEVGLQPMILFGGATGSIGDPRVNAERQLLSLDAIEENLKRQQVKAREIFERRGISPEFVNNLDWTVGVRLLDFLRDFGKHFPMSYMLSKEVVKARLDGAGISYTEFSYMLLQAYDFFHLYSTKNCKLQIGGSDQWGNITAGLELIRRKNGGDAYAFSVPLLTDKEGRKFGKTEAGAIWLDAQATTPYALHQFLYNVDDTEIVRFLRALTFLPDKDLTLLEESLATAPEKREAQKALADAVCTLVHGESATKEANRCRNVLFGGSLDGISESQLEEIFRDVPSKEISRNALSQLTALDLLVQSGAIGSRGEGKRLISGGGAYLNNERLDDPGEVLGPHGNGRKVIVLRTGKKSYYLVRIV